MKLTASLYLASILFFSLVSDCVADSKVEGLEFLLPFQGCRSCIVVSNGVSVVRKKPQVPNTARQASSLPGDISRGKRSSMPQSKTRPDQPPEVQL